MTTSTLVTQLVALLRAANAAPVVEQYWRTEPPTQLTLYVHPLNETQEVGIHMSEFGRERAVTVLAETPWQKPETEWPALVAAVEAVQAVCAANRQLEAGTILTFGPVSYAFAVRPGRSVPCQIADITVTLKQPNRGG